MRSCWSLFVIVLFLSCRTEPPKTVEKIVYKRPIYDGLSNYFSFHEIAPSIILNNNISDNQLNVQLGKHGIKWQDSEVETKISIDDDDFSLRNEVTLNPVWGYIDSVDPHVNHWNEMRLYRVNGREIILISMDYDPCTGIGCSASYYLVYEVRTGRKSFFGTFRSHFRSVLYDLNNNYNLAFVACNYAEGENRGDKVGFIYTVYSIDKDGRFVQQKDSTGTPWQLIHTIFPNDSTRMDTLNQQHWFEKVDLDL